ncbi:MAG: hypothetical protein A2173_00300 [Planctomycetes bacterium RBG_13_44_8b]|nr:MAG: hypothetical protein A2173_00300 [Planctomycetes bacterium RBG_13_44_8b]
MTNKCKIRNLRCEIHAPRLCGDKLARSESWGGRKGFIPLDKADVGLMPPLRTVRERSYLTGFTLVEVLIVLVVIGIAAMIAVPMMSSAASMQIRSAANMVAADLEYAKSMAISRGQSYSVVFETGKKYHIEDQDGNVIAHPIKKGFNYVIDFEGDNRLDRVEIDDVVFNPDASQTITFNYLGSPYSGTTNPLNSGAITLQAGEITKTVHVEPVTGYISITD